MPASIKLSASGDNSIDFSLSIFHIILERTGTQSCLKNSYMNKALSLLLISLALYGCNNPQSTVIPTDMSKLEQIQDSVKKLSEDDRKQLMAYLVRTQMSAALGNGTGPEPGVTIGEALKRQKQWVADQEKQELAQVALKAKLAAEHEAAMKKFASTVTVSVLSKNLSPKNYDIGRYSDVQEIKLGIENLTDKDIAGVKGRVKFYDIFGKEAGAIGFSLDSGIKAKSTETWEGSRDYNQFLDSHKSLAALEEGKYTTKFEPEMIVFTDGTKMTAE